MLSVKLYTLHYDFSISHLESFYPLFFRCANSPLRYFLSLQLLGSKVLFSHQDPPLIRRHSEKPSNYSVIDLRRSSHTNEKHQNVHYHKSPRLSRKFSFPEESSPTVASYRQTNNSDLSSDSDVNRWKHETVVRFSSSIYISIIYSIYISRASEWYCPIESSDFQAYSQTSIIATATCEVLLDEVWMADLQKIMSCPLPQILFELYKKY